MSTELTSAVTITPEVTGVVIDNQNDITATGTYDVTTDTSTSIVEGHKKEYSIVGDALYASINTSEAPTWLTTIISDLVSSAVASGMVNYDLLVQDVYNAIDTIDIAGNTYVEQINFDSQVNALIASQLATLNVSIGDTYATKVELTALESSTTNALATEVNQLEAGYLDAIDAKATEITTAYSAADAVNASNITALTTVFNDQNSELAGQANALSGLQTHIGVDGDNTPDGTGILSRIDILEKQNDGILEYTIDTYDVMTGVQDPNNDTSDDQLVTTAEPYATWFAADSLSATEETRASHIGDVYIKYTIINGTRVYERSYKFIKTIVDNSSPYSTDPDGYTWSLVTDTDAQNAYVAALNAQDLADAKRRVFVTQPTSGPYDIGDLWLVAIGDSAIGQSISGRVIQAGDILRAQIDLAVGGTYLLSHWVFASNYTDDSAVTLLSTGLADGTVAIDLSSSTVDGSTSIVSYINTQLDGQVTVYSGSDVNSAPSGADDDLFIESKEVTDSSGNTYTETTIYKWVTNAWAAQTNADTSIAALADLADGKRTIYSNQSHDVPVGEVNDIWIPTTGTNDSTYVPGEVYQHNGVSWVLATKYSEDLNTFVNTVNNNIVPTLENQIDAKIEYWFAPSSSDPKDGWTVQERVNRDGDVWYQTDTKLSFYYTESNNSWNIIQDADALEAITAAANAQDAADGKVSQFYAWGGASAPADYTADSISIPANDFKYWFKTDNKLYYNPTGTWVVVPTTSNSAVYISSGDLLSVFDPINRDSTNYSYNGTSWQQNGPTGIISTSKFFVDLENDVNGPTGSVTTALSNLEISNNIYADNVGAGVESKFEYGSIVSVNGTYYTTGFGLNSTATSGTGTELDPYDSEFWINAEKLKFTNTSQSGTTTPFSIDASGPTPQVAFNGIVSFSNVSGTPTHTSGATDPTGTAVNGSTYTNTTDSSLWVYSNGWVQSGDPEALVPSDIGPNGTTIINGGLIDTGTITANAIAANAVTADKINVVELSAISATLGTFKSAATGERVEISDDSIRVYDTNGTLRVKIGNLL